MILLKGIGKGFIEKSVKFELIKEFLATNKKDSIQYIYSNKILINKFSEFIKNNYDEKNFSLNYVDQSFLLYLLL